MTVQLDIDFTTPEPVRQAEGEAIWRAGATRFNKVPGKRDTYSITMTTDLDLHLEDLAGEGMDLIRKALPGFHPNSVRAIAMHVTKVGVGE